MESHSTADGKTVELLEHDLEHSNMLLSDSRNELALLKVDTSAHIHQLNHRVWSLESQLRQHGIQLDSMPDETIIAYTAPLTPSMLEENKELRDKLCKLMDVNAQLQHAIENGLPCRQTEEEVQDWQDRLLYMLGLLKKRKRQVCACLQAQS